MKSYTVADIADTDLFEKIHTYLERKEGMEITKEMVDVDGGLIVCYLNDSKEFFLIQELMLNQILIRAEEDVDVSDIVDDVRDGNIL